MSYLGDLHKAHLARRQRLWPDAPRAKAARPVPVAIAQPLPPMIDEEDRATKLAALQRQVAAVGSNLAAMLDTRDVHVRQTPVTLIVKTICAYYGVREQDLMAQRRTRTVVLPRQIAMYLARELTVKSMPEIGRRFGNRDHTTVLHAIRKIEARRADDAGLNAEIAELIGLLSVREPPEAIPAFLPSRAA